MPFHNRGRERIGRRKTHRLVSEGINITQPFAVESFGVTMGVITVGQVFVVEGTGATVGLVAATVDINPAYNITLSPTMRLTGTSPAVSLSVTPASGGSLTYAAACPGLLVEYTTGGILGVGVFRVSYDSGANWAHSLVTIPGGGTYDLDGAATGLRLTFNAGTYVLGDTHEGAVVTLVTSDASAITYTNATASQQPVYCSAVGGEGPYLFFAGAQYLLSTSAVAYNCFVNAPAYSVTSRVAYTVVDAGGTFFGAGNSGVSNNRTVLFGQRSTGTGRTARVALNDVGTSNIVEWSVDGALTTSPTTVGFVTPAAGPMSLYINGTADPGGPQAANPGTLTCNRTAIGSRPDSGPDTFFSGKVYRVVVHNSELTTLERQAWETEVA